MKQKLFTLTLLFVLPLLILWLLFSAQPVPASQTSTIVFVNLAVVGGNNNGTSWADAYSDLQTALLASAPNSGDELWVAAGLYKPTNDTNREATFQLKSGVALYGGFVGTETERDQRDWTVNLTVLSGDIDNNDITTPEGVVTDTANIVGDNSFNVVMGSWVTNTAVLDGFIVTAGYAGISNYLGNPRLTNITFSSNGSNGMHNHASSPVLTNVTFSSNGGIGMENWTSSNPSLTNVTFNGNSDGGMYNMGSNPTLTNVTFNSNGGVGMYNGNSSPNLINVTFSGNSTDYFGGGMYNVDNSNPSLINVTFNNNSANYGGGMYNIYGSPTMTNVTFSNNSANYGGGMYNDGGSPILTNVTFSNNSADFGGGMFNSGSDLNLTHATFNSNNSGGMYNVNSNPNLTDVTFNGNSGGGMHNIDSNPILTYVSFNSNRDGGMNNNNSSPSLNNVTFSSNTANQGGGMANYGGNPELTNVTFSHNTIIYSHGEGSGMYNDGGSSSLTNVIFNLNYADLGGGIQNYGGTVTVSNSIIANSLGGPGGGGNCSGDAITSAGYNISSDSSCNLTATGDMPNTDPLLGPLAYNGGYTLTHMPLADSPAIDAGAPLCPATDQRGAPRPYDGNGDGNAVCDIGSVEFLSPAPSYHLLYLPIASKP